MVGYSFYMRKTANDAFGTTQYLIMNLGISKKFGAVDFEHLRFPSSMRVDYIRVYQDPDNLNVGCDPPDFPTEAYIKE